MALGWTREKINLRHEVKALSKVGHVWPVVHKNTEYI